VAYILKGRSCGTIRFDPNNGTVSTESLQGSNRVTSAPLDSGASVSDHVITEPYKMNVGGTVVGDSSRMMARLLKMCESRDLVEYQGKLRRKNMAIVSWSITPSAENAKGFEFQLSLQEISFATAKTVKLAASKKSIPKKKTKNTGMKTTATATVSSSQYLSSVNKVVAKNTNTSIAQARATTADSGYGR